VWRTLPIYPEDGGSPPQVDGGITWPNRLFTSGWAAPTVSRLRWTSLWTGFYSNASANMNPAVAKFHEQQGQAGFKFLVTAWTIEHTGGPKCYPGRDMRDAHAHLNVSQHDFDVVALEIASTLSFLGAPEKEHREFMDLIESYRSMVVAPSA
jgi:hemoglobin